MEPTVSETTKAIKPLSSGKAPGTDAILAEIYKVGGHHLINSLTYLFKIMQQNQTIPQEFKDANLIHLFKRKGKRQICDNRRGISLLVIAGKILARICLNRLIDHVIDEIVPDCQCGF